MSNDKLQTLLDWAVEMEKPTPYNTIFKPLLTIDALIHKIQSLMKQPSEENVQTQSDTDVGQWRIGDKFYYLETHKSILELNEDDMTQFSIPAIQMQYRNIDAERRTMQAEIDQSNKLIDDADDAYKSACHLVTILQAEIDRLKAQVEGL